MFGCLNLKKLTSRKGNMHSPNLQKKIAKSCKFVFIGAKKQKTILWMVIILHHQ